MTPIPPTVPAPRPCKRSRCTELVHHKGLYCTRRCATLDWQERRRAEVRAEQQAFKAHVETRGRPRLGVGLRKSNGDQARHVPSGNWIERILAKRDPKTKSYGYPAYRVETENGNVQ